MNDIDLTKILKDCPKGFELYSSVHGKLFYDSMCIDSSASKIHFTHPNRRSMIDGSPILITYLRDGKLYCGEGECTIFPSKDQRDWSKFTAPWLEKQGDSLRVNDRAWLYLVSDVLTWKNGVGQYIDNPRVQELAKRLCSEYAQKLYNPQVLSNSSNTGKNEQKFDPKTLRPFDRVLCRANQIDTIWHCDFFSHLKNRIYVCSGCVVDYVVPYNDDTKHLIGTKDEAPEYYRYWED